jgi:hypothetical protein
MKPLRKRTRREKITELEGDIKRILQKVEVEGDLLENATIDMLKDLQQELQRQRYSHTKPLLALQTTRSNVSTSTEGDKSTTLENAPLLSLFDNLVFSREDDYPVDCEDGYSTPVNSPNEYNAKILDGIKDLVPCPPGLVLVLSKSRVALCSLQKIFPELPGLKLFLDDSQVDVLLEFMIKTFASDDVAAAAKVLVCLASCLLRLPSDFDYPVVWFPAPLEILQQCYMEFADALLSPDEGIVGSIDGVRCLIAQVRYHVNKGLPKKAWVIFRRALTFAQLLWGVRHCSSETAQNQREMWLQLWQYDKHLSLHLGLPYAIPHLPFDAHGSENSFRQLLPLGARFVFRLLTVSACVIDRNQQSKSPLISETLAIDLELEKCREVMPLDWWNKTPEPEMPLEDIHEMFTVKLTYYNLRNLIYLPFISQSFVNQEYQWIAHAAQESSREAIKCYGILRDEKRPVFGMCNLLDFQAFTAGLIMILNLLADQSTSQERGWESIYYLIQTFNYASQDKPDSVATRASQLLEELSRLRNHIPQNDKIFQVEVPYLGKIRIKIRRPSSGNQTSEFPQLNHPLSGSPPPTSCPETTIQFDHFIHTGNSQYGMRQGSGLSSMISCDFRGEWSEYFDDRVTYENPEFEYQFGFGEH